jgi:GntR family transcriptional regulator/MocR family aminotransferase
VRIDIDATRGEPLFLQVYRALRSGILEGRLPSGRPLPSSRALSTDLGVSRSTVVRAYRQLQAEGYLRATMGGATHVNPALPDPFLRVARGRIATPGASQTPAGMSERGRRIAAVPRVTATGAQWTPRAFRGGVPALDVFPVDAWNRVLSRRVRQTSPRQLSYGDAFGFRPLREAVADYLGAARGVRCTPDQILIVSGSQQGLDLTSRIVCDPGDQAWLEDPGYHGARGALDASGVAIVPVPVDAEGLSVEAGRRLAPEARLAVVTPSRQLPLGVTMTERRRRDLLQWAHQSGSWILEDDYDSEFRYGSRPLASLQGLDERGCVIYVGTFSKVMFPAMRLGYVVMPDALIDGFGAARRFADFCAPFLLQSAMTDFMVEGHFDRHVRRMRTMYRERQEVLVDAAGRHLAGRLDVPATDGGLTIAGWLGERYSDIRVAVAAAEAGVDVLPVSAYAMANPVRPGLLLGYAGIGDIEIVDGVRRLAGALQRTDLLAREGVGA